MRYAHVIYNSSEKSQSGAVGFGVRCTTEGTPVELTEAMQDNDIFSFIEAGPALTPSALAANPDAIRQIVPTYFFKSIPLHDKSRAFVLGRKIAVGFDYTFYLNGKPGRLGNYVVDSYVFPQPPTAREFEILLEDADSGSNHFIPVSPSPTPDNREMIEISLGHKPYLPVEERPFTSRSMVRVSPQAIELLFSFIQSRKEGKPVLVKSDVASPPRLMAELAKLVPEKQIENLTFLTNHTDEGKKQGINIIFINEFYSFEVFKKQWIWLDLENGDRCESPEATLFRDKVAAYVASGNFDAIHKLVGWCMSDMYEKGKVFPTETQTQLYNYIYNYDEFRLPLMASDANLRNTLNDYFKSNPEEKRKFDKSMQDWFGNIADINGLWKWIDFILAVGPVDCSLAINTNRPVITNEIFKSADSFSNFYNRFKPRFREVLKFVDSNAFKEHDSFLSEMPNDWEALYPLFFSERVADHRMLVERMIADNIEPSMRSRIVAKEIRPPEAYINTLVEILKDQPVRNEWKVTKILAEELSNQNRVIPDFFMLFPGKIEDGIYNRLFHWQLQNFYPKGAADVRKLADYLIRFQRNDMAMTLNGSNVFTRLYSAIKEAVKRKEMTRDDAVRICRAMFQSSYDAATTSPFRLLDKVLCHADIHGENRVEQIWEISKELGDRQYLATLIPAFLASKEASAPKELAKICDFILKNSLMSREALTSLAKTSRMGNEYYVGILLHDNLKPQEELEFLVNDAGMTDEQALNFLERYFPDSHKKILKSRKPSVFQKMSGMFKGMFGKKTDTPEEDDEDNDEEADNPANATPAANGKKGKDNNRNKKH